MAGPIRYRRMFRRPRARASGASRAFRPAVEGMERRALLSGNTYTVNSLGDSGTGSGLSGDLRYAITQAENNPGSTITFGVTGTIHLASALPDIFGNLTIDGPGAGSLTIQGGGPSSDFSVLSVDAGIVDLSGLTISGGDAQYGGGGIFNTGTLTLNGCTVSGNTSTDGGGGGIYNAGTLTLVDCSVSGNSALGTGGGLYNSHFGSATATISGSTFSGNTALAAGGIDNSSLHQVSLVDSTISGNTATDSTDGRGGGISSYYGALVLTNVTITGNRAAGSPGGGLFVSNGSDVVLNNTLIAGNITGGSSSSTPGDVDGPIDSKSADNLIGDGSNLTGISNGSQGNRIGSSGAVINAKLGPLADNGGPTRTVALLAGSPAIDAGSNALAVDPTTNKPLATDQRGTGYPRISNGTVDIGAFEYQVSSVVATKLVVTAEPPSSVAAGSPFGLTVTAEDAQGDVATSFNGTVTLAMAANPGGATLGGTLTVTAQAGVAVFSNLTLDKPDTGYTLAASSQGLTGATTAAFSITQATSGPVKEYPIPSSGANPEGIALGPDGDLWFTEVGTSRIGRLDPTTGTITEYATPTPNAEPVAIVAGPDGNLWFTEEGANQVASINPTTGQIKEIAIPGFDNEPSAIAVGPDQDIWFSIGLTNQIARYVPASGTFTKYNIPTAEADVGSLAVGPDGDLWFTESLKDQIGRLDPTTGAIQEYKVPTSGWGPVGIAAGPDGNLWFTEGSVSQVGSINPSTGAIKEYAVPTAGAYPDDITQGPGQTLWFTELQADQIGEIDPGSGRITEYAIPTASSDPVGIVSGPGGALWFTENAASQVGRLTPPAAAATQLVITTEPPASVGVGAPFGFTVTAEDAAGDVATSFSGTITVALAGGSGGAALGGTLTVTATNGVATFAGLTLSKPGSGYTLQVSGGSLTSATTGAIAVATAAATQLAITAEPPSSVAAGGTFGLTVTAEDAAGDVVTSFNGPVTLSLGNNPEGAALGGTLTVTATNGVATFSGLTLDKIGGGYTLRAAAAGLAGATTSAVGVIAGPATHLVITAQPPSSIGVDAPFGLTVSAEDAEGDVATSFNGSVTLAPGSDPGGASLGGTLTVTASDGVAAFSGLTLDRPGTGDSIQASAVGLTGASSGLIDVTTGTASQLVVTVQPASSVAAGGDFGLTIIAEDGQGNPVASFGGSVTVALASGPTGAVLGGPLTATAVNGVATFSGLTLDEAGDYRLVATSGSLVHIVTDPISVTPGTAARLVVTSPPPADVTAGSGFGLTVAAEDAYGNLATDFGGALSVLLVAGPGGATLGGSPQATATGGVATFSGLTLQDAGGGHVLQVVGGGLSSSPTAGIDVLPAAASRLVVTAQPADGAFAGSSLGLVVEAEDPYGNRVTGFSGDATVVLANNPGGAALSGTTTAPFVDGVASWSGLSLDRGGAGYVLAAFGGGLVANSNAFNVTASPAIFRPRVLVSPTIVGEQVLAVGRGKHRRVSGFKLLFSEAMNPATAANPANYSVTRTVKHGKKTIDQPVAVQVVYGPSDDSVSLDLIGKATFTRGGRIVVNAGSPGGVSDTGGDLLAGNTVLSILPGAGGVAG